VWPVSSLWAPALTGSHQIALRVEVWSGGHLRATTTDSSLQIGGGSVSATARNRVRRTLSLTVPESFYPSDPDDLLNPYGTELRVYRGINYGSAEELVPVFRGRIDSVDDHNRFDGVAEVACSDQGADLNDARFLIPRAAPAGVATTAEMTALIAEAIPDAAILRLSSHDGAVASGLLWDRDRGQAVDDLATSIGVDVWAGPDGTWRITDPANVDQPAVWTLADGANGTIVTDQRTVSRKSVYSVVCVIIERPDGTTPLQVVVEDTDPTSPTYVGGPFGRVPRFLRSSLITSEAQAQVAGRALLAKSTGLTRTRSVTCIPNPALEIGDRLDITVGGLLERHIVDSMTLPLTTDSPAMSITTRSAKPDEGDIES
jgi:hypothetical protein